MGGLSADGRVLWLTGRYDAKVYAISTRTREQRVFRRCIAALGCLLAAHPRDHKGTGGGYATVRSYILPLCICEAAP